MLTEWPIIKNKLIMQNYTFKYFMFFRMTNIYWDTRYLKCIFLFDLSRVNEISFLKIKTYKLFNLTFIFMLNKINLGK